MDMGDLTSRQIGNIMAEGMLGAEEALANQSQAYGAGFANLANMGQAASQKELAAMGRAAVEGLSDADKGTIPSTIRNQNLGHNSKKVGLGPNTKQK